MNVKSFVLDIGIPALVVLATGLGTYMLTGGPEEFPSPESAVDMEDSETLEDVEYEDDGGIGGRDVRSARTDQTAVPAWANGVRRVFFVMSIFHLVLHVHTFVQLAEQTKSLSEEIRLLKEATQANMQLQQEQIRAVMMQRAICAQCRAPLEKGSPASSTETQQPVKRWTLHDWQTQLRCSFWKFAFSDDTVTEDALLAQAVSTYQNRKHETSAAEPSATATDSAERPDPALTPACELLLMYLTNLLKNPTIPRYRRISTVNAAYAKSLAVLPAHEDILRAIGFSRKADSTVFEYEWYNLPVAYTAEAADNVKEVRGGASEAAQRPATAAEAKALLDEAVVLLTALKAGRAAFVEKLASCLTAGDDTSGGEGSVDGTSSGEKSPVVMEAAPVSGTKAFVSAGAGANSSTVVASDAVPAQEPLITVCDLPLNEEAQQTAQPTADSLDFMQVEWTLEVCVRSYMTLFWWCACVTVVFKSRTQG
jgi:hypothetical protein